MLRHVAMLVPVAAGTVVQQFDETHASFCQTTSDKALPSERLRRLLMQPVQILGLLRFLRHIKRLKMVLQTMVNFSSLRLLRIDN